MPYYLGYPGYTSHYSSSYYLPSYSYGYHGYGYGYPAYGYAGGYYY